MPPLEDFLRRAGRALPRPEPADYETAQEVRERLEAIEQMARTWPRATSRAISPEQLRELLGKIRRPDFAA